MSWSSVWVLCISVYQAREYIGILVIRKHDMHICSRNHWLPSWHGASWHGLSLYRVMSWWRHQMEIFSALLAICAGNSPVTGEFPKQRPVTRSFDVYFDLRPKERLSKQSWGWWFETLSRSLRRHRNGIRTAVWRCRKPFSQWQCSFQLKVALSLVIRLKTTSYPSLNTGHWLFARGSTGYRWIPNTNDQ